MVEKKKRINKSLLKPKSSSKKTKGLKENREGLVLDASNRMSFEECENLSDNQLVEITLNKNPQAYRFLFWRYQKSLFIYLLHLVRNKEEAEDILQNVFVKTYNNLHRFDLDRKFSSWIYRIAHNEAVNLIKRKSKRKLVSWDEVVSTKDKLISNDQMDDSAQIFLRKEMAQEMDEALRELPERYRQILLLRYFDEYSYEKIGQVLDKPINTVGTLISRAKNKLVKIIEEKERMI